MTVPTCWGLSGTITIFPMLVYHGSMLALANQHLTKNSWRCFIGICKPKYWMNENFDTRMALDEKSCDHQNYSNSKIWDKNVCTIFSGNPLSGRWAVSVWTKTVTSVESLCQHGQQHLWSNLSCHTKSTKPQFSQQVPSASRYFHSEQSEQFVCPHNISASWRKMTS